MPVSLFQIDAFAAEPFEGNPAAVCLLDAPRSNEWMQKVAAEMNLSETAFLVPGADSFGLRWFTPAVEVDLCGHATLASAHALWEAQRLAPTAEARFDTKSGRLTASKRGDWIELDFPAKREAPSPAPPELAAALGAEASYVGRNAFDYLVLLDDEQAVRSLTPDFVRLRQLSVRGIVVTARSNRPGIDFVSRFFAPGSGIDEDPVTGSAHCCLAPFWGERLGKSEMVGFQASTRGGSVRVRLDGDRVRLGGQAVTIFRGELMV